MLSIINIYNNLCNIGCKFIKTKRHPQKIKCYENLTILTTFSDDNIRTAKSTSSGRIFKRTTFD